LTPTREIDCLAMVSHYQILQNSKGMLQNFVALVYNNVTLCRIFDQIQQSKISASLEAKPLNPLCHWPQFTKFWNASSLQSPKSHSVCQLAKDLRPNTKGGIYSEPLRGNMPCNDGLS